MWPLRGAFKLPLYGRGGRALMAARPAESRVRIDYPLGHTHTKQQPSTTTTTTIKPLF